MLNRLAVLIVILIAALAASDAWAARQSKREQEIASLPPEKLASQVDLEGIEPLDGTLRLSTRQLLKSITERDHYVRAIIDKKSGETAFQVYVWTEFTDDWHMINGVSFQGPDGVIEERVRDLGSKANCSGGRCRLREDVAFVVSEGALRRIVAAARPGDGSVFRYMLAGRYGPEPAREMLVNEIAALLVALDRIRASRGLPSPKPVEPGDEGGFRREGGQ